MMDQITIKDLEVYANHGLYKEEKALGQKFLVSAILSLDTKLAGVSDQTVSYTHLRAHET